ncbi:MAG: hypothetical protein ACOCV8_02720, partial [Spirochaetota bacterium]
RSTDIPQKRITYKKVNRDITMLEMINLIDNKNQLNSSFLYSKSFYINGDLSKIELYENGRMTAYNKRYYHRSKIANFPLKEEHWELDITNKELKKEIYAEDSAGNKRMVFDENGFELKTVWLYDNIGFYKSEEYEDGKLQTYHIYYYYGDTRRKIQELKLLLNEGEINENEYNKRYKEAIQSVSPVISQIDDFEKDGTFNTRRFYTTFSTLMEVRYYDENNVNRLIEYYNKDGKISSIDIKNENGNVIETYSTDMVDMEFILEKRREVRDEKENK